MEDATTYARALETKITRHQSGAGYLEVHTKYANGQKIMEAFTLASLAEVLDMPMTTMEGRYARARLNHWKVDIPTGTGRPTRGFPLAQLADVVHLIRTPGAFVKYTPNGDEINKQQRDVAAAPLVPTYHLNKPYFTMQALADHFGYSATTIRNKLQKAGLMRRMVNLGTSPHGGRPSRGIPESALADVKLAIVDGAKFITEIDRVIASAGGQREQAKEYVRENIAPHTPPPAGSVRAWDHDTLAPVIPLNAVNPPKRTTAARQVSTDQIADEVAAELESIIAQHAKPEPYAPPLAGDRTPAETVPSPAEPEVDMEALVAMHRETLIGAAEEPTEQDYADTVYMLNLSKADADQFVAEVKAARGAA